jgi:hypothetical protein
VSGRYVFTIRQVSRAGIRNMAMQQELAALDLEIEPACFHVNVLGTIKRIELVILPAGVLLVWRAAPQFILGATTPEEALDRFFRFNHESLL